MHSHDYQTLVEAQTDLRARGFTVEFSFKDGKLAGDNGQSYAASQLTSLEDYRFEGMTNPGDESILVALRAHDGARGYAISAYGPYADQAFMEFLAAIPEEQDTEVESHP